MAEFIEKEFGLPERTLNDLRNYFRAVPEVKMVKIYGSRAVGTYRRGSDIDFAVYSDTNMARSLWSSLDALPTPYMFDVTDYNTLKNEALKKEIDDNGKVFYERKD